MATAFQVTFDCAEPERLASFWAAALGYVVQPPPEPFETWDEALDAWGVPEEERDGRSAAVDPDGVGPRLYFQRVPEGKIVKNRVHLDVRLVMGLEGEERRRACDREVARLEGLGATKVRELGPDGVDELCIVMQDPEGNEFCID